MTLSFVCGLSFCTLDLFGPLLFADLAGTPTGGSAVFGIVMAVAFLGGAMGAWLGPTSRLAAVVAVLAALVALRLPEPGSGDEEALFDEALDDRQHLLGGLVLGEAGAHGEHRQQIVEPAGAVATGQKRRAVGIDPT